MHRPKKSVRAMKPGTRQKPVEWGRAIHLQIAGGFLICILVMIGGGLVRSRLGQRESMDRMMNEWKSNYHLSDEQVARIRKIEEDFHGTWNLLIRPAPTWEQQVDHEPSISRVMAPDDAARFLADREQLSKNRKRPIRAHAH